MKHAVKLGLIASADVAGIRVLGSYPLTEPDRALAMLAAALPIRIRRSLPWWTSVEARGSPELPLWVRIRAWKVSSSTDQQ